MNKVITVPNILSVIRLCLIPVIIWEYIFLENYFWAAITVVISGATDVVDGFIARKFNMVSHVGRILDPAADKLTQIAVIACLCVRFNMMIVPLAILVVKELVNGIIALKMLKTTGKTINSEWHGKLATVFLYLMITVHLFWVEIPLVVSDTMIGVSIALMTLSFVLYVIKNLNAINQVKISVEDEVE
ncbi:MAG: CDP-alcohol phosphatidyltransferase family protein [Clostridia bacterium]|nr:CDP-alcohol phosphatidyltransferase family protein [Clostridia bacterium]